MLVRKARQRAAWARNWLMLNTILSICMMHRDQTGKPAPDDTLPPATCHVLKFLQCPQTVPSIRGRCSINNLWGTFLKLPHIPSKEMKL